MVSTDYFHYHKTLTREDGVLGKHKTRNNKWKGLLWDIPNSLNVYTQQKNNQDIPNSLNIYATNKYSTKINDGIVSLEFLISLISYASQ